MLRHLHARRRPHFGAHACALIAALLLLLSVSLLYSRLGSGRDSRHYQSLSTKDRDQDAVVSDPLLDDTDPDDVHSGRTSDDRIDELDDVQDESDQSRVPDEEELEAEEDEETANQSRVSGFYFDHVNGVVRRAFDKRSIDQWEDYESFAASFAVDQSKVAFGSDDVPVDEDVRRKMVNVEGIEDALLLKLGGKVSRLREGWGPWFDAKSDFLRRDRMFKSNLENLNPLNNPLLQDPDGVGVTGLTRGDKLVQKGWLNEFKKVPFLVKKPLGIDDSTHQSELKSEPKSKSLEDGVEGLITKSSFSRVNGNGREIASMKKPLVIKDSIHELELKPRPKSEMVEDGVEKLIKVHTSNVNVNVEPKKFASDMKRVDRRSVDEKASNVSLDRRTDDDSETFRRHVVANSLRNNGREINQLKTAESVGNVVNLSSSNLVQSGGSKNVKANNKRTNKQFSSEVYANGKRWGYFPGLHPRLSFSNFMDGFFRKGRCSMRFFMVWNSPPWMFSVRHQRGIESLLFHHRDACLVVFSETIELNFFEGFVKDGFKVAVAMPNLDELLKDTPTHIFASIWYEWRQTSFYSTHYSELIRLAALYKYGGLYLDSDVIVLRPLSSLNNTVGMEDQQAGSSVNGAVMSFRKHSPFIVECLSEFYSNYDDTRLRWNGADLLTRVARDYMRNMNITDDKTALKLQPPSVFFPISRDNITRYFSAPETESQRAEQNELFDKILNESFTFHFWNSLTSALVPEPESLVARIINHPCIRCSDIM